MVAALQSTEVDFSNRLSEFLGRVECRRAVSETDLDEIYKLRYDAYRGEEAIVANKTRRFTDSYDQTENAWIFGMHLDGRLVSSIRIHVASPEHPDTPAMAVFPDLLQSDLQQGRTIIDPTRFVSSRAAARAHPELAYATVRLGFVAVQHFDADIALATVRSEHQTFYRRLFDFKPMCMPRTYPTLTKPIILMENRDHSKLVELASRYPFLSSTPQERQFLFGGDDVDQPLPMWQEDDRGERRTGATEIRTAG